MPGRTEKGADRMTFWKGLWTFFGLVPENQDLARRIQRWWFLATLLWAVFLGFGAYKGFVCWISRGFFVLLAILLFLDGAWGFPWAGKWLLLLGGWYLFICGGGWALGLLPDLPTLFLLGCLLLSLSCLWPLFVTGDILGFPYYGSGYFPSCFLVWCGLALAWLLGWGIRRLRPRERKEVGTE